MDGNDCSKVLAYCFLHGSITAREAFIKLDINSPRKVFSELRRKGYELKPAEKMPNGKHKPYHRYFFGKVDADG